MDSRYGISLDRYRGNDPPSFSSTLLDSICRSFDDSRHDRSRSILLQSGDGGFNCGNSNAETMMRSSSCYLDRSVRRTRGVGEADGGRSRDRIVDRWMEKTTIRHEEFVVRRISVPLKCESSAVASDCRGSLGSVKMKSSSTSSSDSSSGFGFSSSDTDSFSAAKKNKSLKPIRTSVSDCSETFRPLKTQFENFGDEILYRNSRHSDRRPAKCDSRKTAKSRAMKIYGDLKRMKQPISPGGKLASFLNSLFSAGSNGKKQRISTSMPATATIGNYDRERCERSESKSNFTTASTPSCSTASSYGRSCLSKPPTSAGRYGGEKRSVRFCPLSVIVDEDLRPCGHKCLHSDGDLSGVATSRRNSNAATGGGLELTLRVVENNRKSVEEVAMDLMRNYYKKWELDGAKEAEMIENQDDAEDVESCCSADLFELENLMEIGVDRYSAELPVYETTHVNTNRAIASGLIM